MTNFGIVGTGSISGHFVKSIGQIEGAQLMAMCSSSPERADTARQRYEVPVYSDLIQMLAREEIDVVCICTASGMHLTPAKVAAEHGKHVLCEKPLEINTSRIDEMINACAQNGVTLGCIFQNRYSDAFLRLRHAVEDGRLGSILALNAVIPWYRSREYYANSPWRGSLEGDGGGALINQGIHTLDLFQLLGGKVRSVSALVRTMRHKIEGEDIAMANIEFISGAIGHIQASTTMWPGYPERLEVYGEEGSIILEGGQVKEWRLKSGDTEQVSGTQSFTGSSDPMAIGYELHRKQIELFVQAIKDEMVPEVDGYEARKSVELINAIYSSSRKGEIVFLND